MQEDAFIAIERLAGEASPEVDRKKAEKKRFLDFLTQNSLTLTYLSNLQATQTQMSKQNKWLRAWQKKIAVFGKQILEKVKIEERTDQKIF